MRTPYRTTPPMGLSLPPFSGAVKWLILINAGIFLAQVLIGRASPDAFEAIIRFFGLVPSSVVSGYIWQVVTYAFLHGSPGHLFFNMLAIWMFGSRMESHWGTRQFLEFYFFCAIGAAVASIVMAYTGLLGVPVNIPTVGASGAYFGILMAFGYLYGDSEIMLFPIPFMIRAKYLVGVIIFFTIVGALAGGGSTAYVAHLGGLIFGFVYVRFLPRRGLRAGLSEGYYGARNRYYRWKRRRAARKFEVYMRKVDRSQYFDEYGNFRDPDDKKDDNGESKSPWVH